MLFTPFAFMFSTTPAIMSGTGCATQKTHGYLSGGGATGASAICGVFVSTATSATARLAGVIVDPRMMSTLSSVANLRALRTAAVVSVASSSTM
jgi:hypothetical protein